MFKNLLLRWLAKYFLSHDLLQEYAADHVKLHVVSFGHQAQQIIDLEAKQEKLEQRYENFLKEQRRIDESVTSRVRKIEKVLEYNQLKEG